MQNNIKEKKDDITYKTSLFTKNEIYEMGYDTETNKTYYLMGDRDGKIENFLDEVEIDGRKYKPLPARHLLVEKKVILFPSIATPYEDENQILKEIQNFIHKYLDISDVFEQISTYYVLFTWMYDRFNEVPYLRAIGDFGSGKSRMLQTIGMLCYKPVFTEYWVSKGYICFTF
ncbi:MAG: hypothetical protein NTU76_03575 [Candidatus Taylorbacteria bacterium]|nr:hypothetical protein [Candidatus Taylorbacteria bacterium]